MDAYTYAEMCTHIYTWSIPTDTCTQAHQLTDT